MNKKVYVAGPYSAVNLWGRIKNILRARKVAKRLCELGYYPYCPHMNTALFDSIQSWEFFMDMHMEYLKECDYMVLLPNSKSSKGTQIEIKYATDNNITIFFNINVFEAHMKINNKELY